MSAKPPPPPPLPPAAMPMPQALDPLGCPLRGIQLVEASAGTGKTWAICALVLRLLVEARLTVGQVLVVTFTNAATAELRERIRQRLAQALAHWQTPPLAPDPFLTPWLASLRARGLGDDAVAAPLQAALHGFDEAAVFTIHGFCQRALADAAFTAQVPLKTTLLTDDSALRQQVVNDFWRRQVAGSVLPPALALHLVECGDSPPAWAALLKRHLAKPLARVLWPAALDEGGGCADKPADIAAVANALANAVALWSSQRDSVLHAVDAALPGLHKGSYKPDTVRAAAAEWDALAQADHPLAALGERAKLLGSTLLAARCNKGHTAPRHPFFSAAQAFLDMHAAASQSLRLGRLRLLRQLLAEAPTALAELKRGQRAVAFDDMLANLHARLVGDQGDALAQALQQRFPAALIDEFQDTDPLQWAIFERVYGQPVGDAAAGDAPLFLVGDPKQAIYSFRNADLATYLAARARATATWTLTDNQRASAGLITALNTVFGHHPQAFMLPGLQHHPVRLGAKPRSRFVDRSGGPDVRLASPLQLWRLPRTSDGQALPKAQALQAATAATAAEIARLLAAAQRGEVLLDGTPLAAGHMAVLVRSHRQGSAMRQALARLNVGSVELSQQSVFASPDAEALATVLAAVAEPGREPLLKAALATPVLGLDAAQIVALAADEPAWLAHLQRLADWRDTWQQRGIGTLLRRLMAEAGVATRLLAQPDGERRLTNLQHLAECLHQAATEHPAPEALLLWLQGQRSEGRSDEATQLRLESDRHLVQIVTIHKSKGLEYPLVFCPFLWDGRSSGRGDGLDGSVGHDDAGNMLIDFREVGDDTLDKATAQQRSQHARRDAAAEDLRVVYVALTRAVHRCTLVVGGYAAAKGSTAEAARGALGWLAAGGAFSADDWLARPAKDMPPPDALDQAWAALAMAANGVADPVGITMADPAADLAAISAPPISCVPLATQPGDPLAPQATPAEALRALPPPAYLPLPWRIGSYSALAHGARHDGAAQDHDLRVTDKPAAAMAAQGPDGQDSPGDAFEPVDAFNPFVPFDPFVAVDPSDPNDGGHPSSEPDPDSATTAGPDPADDDLSPDAPVLADNGGPADPSDILNFPRGPEAGDCLHAVFEAADFSDPGTWPAAISTALRHHGPALMPALSPALSPSLATSLSRSLSPPASAASLPPSGPAGASTPALVASAETTLTPLLHRMLADVLATPLPVGTAQPLRLAALRHADRLTELEFHLPVPQLNAEALNALLARHGLAVPPLHFNRLRGYLKGFMDLVLCHDGRWFVLDWKSNHLGEQPADYGPAALEAAMAREGYHLQHLLYSVALQRWLARRLAGYTAEQHFGGALYLFVRGVRPGWRNADGTPCGLYFQPPSAQHLATVAALDALLQHGGGGR